MHEQVNDPTMLRPISAESLIVKIEEGEKLLITGEEKSGKSTLLLQYHKVLRSEGWVPVYFDVAGISFKTKGDAEKRIAQSIESQYVNPDMVPRMARKPSSPRPSECARGFDRMCSDCVAPSPMGSLPTVRRRSQGIA